MSLRVLTDVFCDGTKACGGPCSKWVHGVHNDRCADGLGARRVARNWGWRRHGDLDLCPDCVARRPKP